LRVDVVSSLGEVPAAAWNALAGSSDPFLRHEFLYGLERHRCLDDHGWYPQHLLAHDGERLVGALPLYARDNSQGEFVFDWSWAEAWQRAGGRYYPKLVTAVPFTPVAGRRLLLDETAATAAAIAQALIAGARALAVQIDASSWHCLFPVDAQLPLLEGEDLLLREGCQYHWYNAGYADFDAFLASLSSKRRKEIRRERREIADSGLHIELLEGAAITPAHWRIFHRFYRDTFARKWGEPRLTLAFMQSLSETLPEAPVLLLARDGEEYVAGAFALRGGDTLYGRHWGCTRYVRHLHFELCYYRCIDYAIAHGLAHFDAGAQGEHKVPRGFMPVRTWSVHWLRDPGFRRAVADFLRRETLAVDAYVEDVAAHTAYPRGARP